MNNINWKQIYARKKADENRIKKLCPEMENKSGIYIWYRAIFKFYAGQSVKLIDRSIQHLQQYDHLGLSIKKHGLYDKDKNPMGWRLKYYYCDSGKLNELEREEIAKWSIENIPYNITSGGQDSGKVDINERQASKNYHDGLKQGYLNAIKEVAEYFEKYLDFSIKEPKLTKGGKPIVIKTKKYEEFKKLLGGTK